MASFNSYIFKLLSIVVWLGAAAACRGAGTGSYLVEYRADSPEIRYTGRTLAADDGSVSFDWAGVYITTVFEGTTLRINASDTGESYYNVSVDGVNTGVIRIASADTVIVVAEGLDRGAHTVRLQKRSEGEFGRTTVHSLSVDGSLATDTLKKSRRIEFIGDSLTSGYGTEGSDREEPFLVETENCDLTYACIIARYFDADYTLISHSGRGAARNYGDTLTTSQGTMRDRMMRTFDEDPAPAWDFARYRPDLVVINLGSNDFSTSPHPSREEFTDAYTAIIKQLREGYGEVPVLCVSPRVGEPAMSYIMDICRNSGDANVYFGGSMNGIYNNTTDMGAAWHPGYRGQLKMAHAIIPFVSTVTGWGMERRVIE